MKTILLSTSSLWNCGDDFIREGVLQLLNLHDDVRPLWWNRGFGIQNNYLNSLKVNLPLVDYFIVAGTPQWVMRNEAIYEHCLANKIPLSIVGVGTKDIIGRKQTDLMQKVASSGLCEVALGRDPAAVECLKSVGFERAELIMDPAFFMKRIEGTPELNILGWRDYEIPLYDPMYKFLHPLKWARVQQRAFFDRAREHKTISHYDETMVEIFRKMAEPKVVVLHDNREVSKAIKLFGDSNLFYATDYRLILKKFGEAISYVGSRLHGAVPAVSNGAGAHLIYRDSRWEALRAAKEILKRHDGVFEQCIQCSVVGKDEINAESTALQGAGRETFDRALGKEKQRIQKLLASAPVLSGYMNGR